MSQKPWPHLGPATPPVGSDAAAAAEAARLRGLMQRPTVHGDPIFDSLLRELWIVLHCIMAGLAPPAAEPTDYAPTEGGPSKEERISKRKTSSIDAVVEAEVRALLSGVQLDGSMESPAKGEETDSASEEFHSRGTLMKASVNVGSNDRLVGLTGAPLALEAELRQFLGPAGLGPFLGALLDFGVESLEDLCDPDLVTDALLQEHCGMDLTDLKALRRAAAARSNALETNARLAAAVPPFEAVSPAWRACGFSSEDPALEFRGTGLLGAQCVLAALRDRPAAAALLLRPPANAVPLVASCVATVLHVAHLLGVTTASTGGAPAANYASLTAAAAAADSAATAAAALGATAGSVEVGSPLAQARRLLLLGDHLPNDAGTKNNDSSDNGSTPHYYSSLQSSSSSTYATTTVTLSGDLDDYRDDDDDDRARSCSASNDNASSSSRYGSGGGRVLSPLNRGFAAVQGVAFHLLCRAAADTNCRSAMDFKALLQACQEDLALLLAMHSSSSSENSSPLSPASTHSGGLSTSSPGGNFRRRNSGSAAAAAASSKGTPPPYALFSEPPPSVPELWARAQLLPQRRSGLAQHLTCAQGLLTGNSKRGNPSGKPTGRRVAWCVLAAGRLRVYDRAASAAATMPGSNRHAARSSFSRGTSSGSNDSSSNHSAVGNGRDSSSSSSSTTEAKVPMGSATAVLGTLPLGEFRLFPTARITTAPDDPCRVQVSDCGDMESDSSYQGSSSHGHGSRKSFWRSSPARPPSLEFTCGSEGEAEKWCVAFTEHVALLLLASDHDKSTYFQVTGRLPIASSALSGVHGI